MTPSVSIEPPSDSDEWQAIAALIEELRAIPGIRVRVDVNIHLDHDDE